MVNSPEMNSEVLSSSVSRSLETNLPFAEYEMDEDLKRIDDIDNILDLEERG